MWAHHWRRLFQGRSQPRQRWCAAGRNMKAGLSMWSRVQEGSWCCGLIVQHYRGTMVESHRKGSDVISLPSFTLTMLWNLIQFVSLHCQWWNVTNCIFYQYNFDVPVLYLCISIHINLLDQKHEYPVQLSVSMSVLDFPSAARSHTPLNLLAVRPHSHNRPCFTLWSRLQFIAYCYDDDGGDGGDGGDGWLPETSF